MAAAETARLIASLELQDKNFTRGIRQVERGVDRVDRKLGAFSGFLNRNMARAIDSLASRGVDALGDAIQAGSDLNEEITKSQAVFGAAAKDVIAFSETTSAALGLSQKDALAAAGNFGNMFKTIGLTEKKSGKFSKRLVELAADMASFNNEDPTEMLDKIRSGLAGEAEPLRRFGVLLSAARVQEEAYASGIAKRGETLTEAQKVQARYNLILKDTAVQQGDVAKTGGNLAGQQRKLNAMLADASATIGTALLPAVTDVTAEFVKLFSSPEFKEGLKSFARDLGKGAKDLIASLKQVDWKGFASALGTAAGFARDLVKAFLGLPSWLQTAVITGWGLNKITGGFLTDLAGGLIKGVLGMNAGVVNINAGVVNGPGGVPGVGGGGGLLGLVGRAVLPVAILSIGAGAAIALTNALDPGFQGRLQGGDRPLANRDPRRFDSNGRVVANWEGDLKKAGDAAEALGVRFGRIASTTETGRSQGNQANTAALAKMRDSMSKIQTTSTQQRTELGNIKNSIATQTNAQKTAAVAAAATAVLQGSLQAGRDAVQRTTTATAGTNAANASRAAGNTTAAAMSSAASRIVAAVYAARPIIRPTNIVERTTTIYRTGDTSGSRGTARRR